MKELNEATPDFDRFYTDRRFEKDMVEIAGKLNELLDSAIVYENYQQVYIDTVDSDLLMIPSQLYGSKQIPSYTRSKHFEIFNNKMGVPL